MSLFDNTPLTEEEIASRVLCICTHSYGQHEYERRVMGWMGSGADACTECECDEFEEVNGE